MTINIYLKLTDFGTSPALTYYGVNRIELSGKVLANHAAKISNFLSLEVGILPSDPVLIDLPTHWKGLTWTIGALLAGADIIFPDDDATSSPTDVRNTTPRVVVTNRPEAHTGNELIALDLDDLSLAWPSDLPTGAYDGAADPITFPDALLADESDSSNIGELIDPNPTKYQRVGLVNPSPRQFIAVALRYLSDGSSVVVTTSNRDHIDTFTIEGANIL